MRSAPASSCAALLAAGLVACAHPRPLPERATEAGRRPLGQGLASYYGPGLYGRRTASGEQLVPGTFTAAHRTLPFGTCVRVINLDNGRSARVRINDRGPFVSDRVIDVSEAAARRLGMWGRGVAHVRLLSCREAPWR